MSTIRLNKLLSSLKLASRREADRLITKGIVSVRSSTGDFVPAVVGDRVAATLSISDVRISDTGQLTTTIYDTVILHKPLGFVSSQPEVDDEGNYVYDPAIQLLEEENFDHSAVRRPSERSERVRSNTRRGNHTASSIGHAL